MKLQKLVKAMYSLVFMSALYHQHWYETLSLFVSKVGHENLQWRSSTTSKQSYLVVKVINISYSNIFNISDFNISKIFNSSKFNATKGTGKDPSNADIHILVKWFKNRKKNNC